MEVPHESSSMWKRYPVPTGNAKIQNVTKPFNIAEGAALLHLVARLTGYKPRWFSYFIGDAHIYENHMEMVQEQLKRDPLPLPQLQINSRVPSFAETGKYEPEWLEKIEPSDFTLEGYQHHAPLTAPMAV